MTTTTPCKFDATGLILAFLRQIKGIVHVRYGFSKSKVKKGVLMKKKGYCTRCHEELDFFDDILGGYCVECDVPVDEYGQEIKDRMVFKPENKDVKR